MENTNFDEGMKILERMLGENKYAYMEKLNSLYDGLGNAVAEQIFGKLYTMKALDLKTKQLITIALLLDNGDTEQLVFHTQCALNLGVEKEQIIEMMLQSTAIIGVPKALRGIKVVRELLEK